MLVWPSYSNPLHHGAGAAGECRHGKRSDQFGCLLWGRLVVLLMLIGGHGGDPMMARIAVMRALHRDKPKAAPASVPRRKRAKAYRIVR